MKCWDWVREQLFKEKKKSERAEEEEEEEEEKEEEEEEVGESNKWRKESGDFRCAATYLSPSFAYGGICILLPSHLPVSWIIHFHSWREYSRNCRLFPQSMQWQPPSRISPPFPPSPSHDPPRPLTTRKESPENPQRILKESPMNLKRIPNESQKNFKKISKESQKNLKRIPKESLEESPENPQRISKESPMNIERILMKNLERMSIRTGRVRKGILGSDGKFWRRGNAVRAAHARTHALPIKRHKRPKAPNATTRWNNPKKRKKK